MEIVRQFLCFSGVGVVGTGAHFFTLISLVSLARMDPVTASVFGFIAGALVNYILNYYFTFRSSKRHRETMGKFFAVAALGLVLNTGMMEIAVNRFAIHYLLSQMAATCIVLLWNFTGSRVWVFRQKEL
jgi:putative flippase GtrA